MTLLQLRSMIYIDLPQLENNPDFPPARVNQMINFAQREIQRQLSTLGLKRWTKQTSVSGASLGDAILFGLACKVVSTPSTMLMSVNPISSIDLYNSTTFLGVAREVNLELFKEIGNNLFLKPGSKDSYFAILGNSVYIFDFNDILSDIIITHEYIVPDLSSDAGVTEIPAEYEEYIIKRVILEAKGILGMIQDKEIARNEFMQQLSDAYSKFVQKDKDKVITETKDKAVLQ